MTKRLKISKFIGRNKSNHPKDYRKNSIANFATLADVTEDSLKVWCELPTKIRQDPSLALFQAEHERLHGKSNNDSPEDSENPDTDCISSNNEDNTKETGFVTLKINQDGDNISGRKKTSVASTQPDDNKPDRYKRYTKQVSLFVMWLIMTALLASTQEKHIKGVQLVVPSIGVKQILLNDLPTDRQFKLFLKGGFNVPIESLENETNFVEIRFQIVDKNNNSDLNDILDVWRIPTVSPDLYEYSKIRTVIRHFELSLSDRDLLDSGSKSIQLELSKKVTDFETDEQQLFSLELFYDPRVIDIMTGAVFGALILIIMYVLIIWEIVHRTFASMISATMGIAILGIFGDRPTMSEIVVWMDIDTLLLLFSMMTLVAVLTETGIFDYIAVLSFEITNGKIWPLIHCLCLITCLVSGFLDNVTTVLLMTPITIRLCEVMKLDPVPILMAIVVHANIGGTMTPIGDPPNIIITNNHYIQTHGVTFITFVAHMVPGVILIVIQSSLHFRYIFRDIHSLRLTESEELKNLRREISVWRRAAGSINSFSKDADAVKTTLQKKVRVLRRKFKKMELAGTVSTDDYNHTLESLRAAYPIRNKPLLIKSASVLVFILLMFFIESVPEFQRLSFGWVALLGVILLLIIAERDDMDSLVSRIEWTTLLFFAAMFVTMESLSRLGLITWIGNQTESIILSVPQESRLGCAIFLVLWISAISSAFVDSIPITAMMVKVVVALAENDHLKLPLQPLVWALTFGPCLGVQGEFLDFGNLTILYTEKGEIDDERERDGETIGYNISGNGTVYGASANVVCAGIAEQHGYKISFMKFFKIVFPMMLSSVIVITVYLLVSHVLFDWH